MTEESRKSESPEEVNGELPIVKQTQNMEVDHQTDLQHTRKKFKEYFFVFCFDIRSFGYPLTLAIK
jgi:hypothetical protein